MISERDFSITYTSLWREITPSADNFVRHLNLATDRFVAPYVSKSPSHLNGIINETAFRICRNAVNRGDQELKTTSRNGRETWDEVCIWLGELPSGRFKLSNDAWSDVVAISRNIFEFVRQFVSSQPIFEPQFVGCGVVSKCAGDILAGDLLVEVKAGARGFRSIDLRQLFTYCALARVASTHVIERLCLVNPRWGVVWTSTLEDAATSCGAASAGALLDDIIEGAVLLGVST